MPNLNKLTGKKRAKELSKLLKEDRYYGLDSVIRDETRRRGKAQTGCIQVFK